VIIFSGFIAENIGLDNFEKYVAKIPKHLPVVSISFSIPGVSSVLVDNVAGIYNAVEHLIQCHGKKKIAFVKGPDGHSEAEDRLDGFKKALVANRIPFDERYVLPGHFSQESGHAAVAELIDKRKLSVDAIVASDDETAIGVMNELKHRSILVPSDIAVTGFDDDRFSATFIPSISTARQDFFEIGLISAETLCKKISGEPLKEVTLVAPVFITRQSCGCLENYSANTGSGFDDVPIGTDSLISYMLAKFTLLFRDYVPKQQIQEWFTALVEIIKEKPFPKAKYLYLFNDILINYSHYSKNFSPWQEGLNILSMGVEFHHDSAESTHLILSTMIHAATLVHDIRFKEGKIQEFTESDAQLLLRRVAGNLVLLFDVDSLAEELHRSLPELSINTALVGLYHAPVKNGNPDADRKINILIGFEGERKFNMKNNSWNSIPFSDYSTIDGFDFERERRTLLFLPLFFKEEEVGVVLLPYDPQIPVVVYETLRINISAAVKGAELLLKIRTLSITDELTGLLNRRGFFQFVYSRIKHLYRNKEMIPFVIFMDMDGLKIINDTYGHNEGDIAISAFANILREVLREEDIIGRIGGDEFVVFSSARSKESVEQVVSRIREKIEEYNSRKLHPYDVAGSIGCVILDTATKEYFEAAMLSADSVLHEEKMLKKKKGLSRE
jgi:diguanylate cyclase (GGDEF)-like protein